MNGGHRPSKLFMRNMDLFINKNNGNATTQIKASCGIFIVDLIDIIDKFC